MKMIFKKTCALKCLKCFLCFMTAMLFVASFSFCEKVSTRDYFKFADKEFTCEIRGETDGLAVGATVHSMPGEGNCEPDFEVTYISPEALRGIKIKKLQNMNLSVDGGFGSVIPKADLDGLVDFVHMIFSFKGTEQRSITYENEKAKICICSKDCEAEYTFDSRTGQPLSIKGRYGNRNIELVFEWIEYAE